METVLTLSSTCHLKNIHLTKPLIIKDTQLILLLNDIKKKNLKNEKPHHLSNGKILCVLITKIKELPECHMIYIHHNRSSGH